MKKNKKVAPISGSPTWSKTNLASVIKNETTNNIHAHNNRGIKTRIPAMG
jgi:hypothetical protein